MKICLVHNRYLCPGGEDAVVAAETDLLRLNGHDVRSITTDNTAIKGLWGKAMTAWRVHYSKGFKDIVADTIGSFKPDIVHVHNFFPLITPSVYDACREYGIKTVQTLHNYRTICAAALLMRQGRVCEECIGGSAFNGARHRCYRGSWLGSLAVARMVDYHRRRGTWQNKVDMFIALTEFSRRKFIQAGFPPDRITVKPNYLPDPYPLSHPPDARVGALFVGRLSQEKGVKTLFEAWRGLGIPLTVLGDGPMMGYAADNRLPGVAFLGHVSPPAVESEMKKAAFLVMPSECYEGFPIALLESFAHGLPVIASRLGSMAEIIEDGVTGLHFKAGDVADLTRKVRWAAANPGPMRQMGENARAAYRVKFTPDMNYKQLVGIYSKLLDKAEIPIGA
jgi:glycosyltransferase involved in cell wall biosynthesis